MGAGLLIGGDRFCAHPLGKCFFAVWQRIYKWSRYPNLLSNRSLSISWR